MDENGRPDKAKHGTGEGNKVQPGTKASAQEARQQRLAAQLKANLKRRKQQARARSTGEPD